MMGLRRLNGLSLPKQTLVRKDKGGANHSPAKMLDFILYTCSYGRVTVETIEAVERLRETDYKFEWWFQSGDALIARSRSVAAYKFLLEGETPYMIFLDDDIVFEPKDIGGILESLEEKDVVCGLCCTQGDCRLAQYGWNGRVPMSGKVEDIEYISTGFLGISRKILEKIGKNMPILHKGEWCECKSFFESKAYKNIFLSEDYDFCHKVRGVGKRVYAHTGVMVKHIKNCIIEIK